MSDEEDVLNRATERIGTVLHGKYRLDAVLGVGGMAVVYAATHRNRKRFAIKLLHPEFSVRTEFRARFLREGYAANSVAHEGVVAVLDDDIDETGAAFLVMELLSGADVQALRARSGGKLPLQVVLQLALQVLSVLAAAHEKAIVHRDIKPANLFLVDSGQVKVLDFGIARLHDASSQGHTTRSGAVLGTPAFMAPEQAAAQSGEVDARTDLWALGASLFTLLSGQFVHEAESGRETLIRAATLPARSLSEVAPEVPASVVALVNKALMFDKAARWESAAEMSEAVAAAQRDLFGEPSREALQAYLQACGASSEASESSRVSSGLVLSNPVARLFQAARAGQRGTLILGLCGALLGAALFVRGMAASGARKGAAVEQSASLPAARGADPLALRTGAAKAELVASSPPVTPAVEAAPAHQPQASVATVAPKARLAKLARNTARSAKPPAAEAAPAGASTSTVTALAPVNPLQLELQ
jgi:eukaryotic-like serine/threonine-protein kinase